MLLKEPWWIEGMSGKELDELSVALCKTHNCTEQIATAIANRVVWLRSAISAAHIANILLVFLQSGIQDPISALFNTILTNHTGFNLTPSTITCIASCLRLHQHDKMKKYLHEAASLCNFAKSSLRELSIMLSALGSASLFGPYTSRVCQRIELLVVETRLGDVGEADPAVISPLREQKPWKLSRSPALMPLQKGNHKSKAAKLKETANEILMASISSAPKIETTKIPVLLILRAIAKSSLEKERIFTIAHECCLRLLDNQEEYNDGQLSQVIFWLSDLHLRSPLLLQLAIERCSESEQAWKILSVLLRMRETSMKHYLELIDKFESLEITQVGQLMLLINIRLLVRSYKISRWAVANIDAAVSTFTTSLRVIPLEKIVYLFLFLVSKRLLFTTVKLKELTLICANHIRRMPPTQVPHAREVFRALSEIKKNSLLWRREIVKVKEEQLFRKEWVLTSRVGITTQDVM